MSKKQCVLFAGQSVQEQGLCRELWKLDAARDILLRLKPVLGDDLEYVTTEMPDQELARTYNTQRAIHSHHLGHWFAYLAKHPGMALDGAIGHSMGVVAALTAAGAMSVEDSAVFIKARAESFAEACRNFKEPMGFAAVSTDYLEDVVPHLSGFPNIELALHNTIGRGVLGGTLADLEAFTAKAQAEGWPIKFKVLRVEGPYHTKAFSSCRTALAKSLETIKIVTPQVPVFMGTSGRAETEPERIKELLIEQADSRERHFEAVWAAYDAGCRNFIEIAHKPQPVTWIGDQLQNEDGQLMPDVTTLAVKTTEI
jgi:[acyl-carrier-protein] S-malonyltransferase